MIVRLYVSLGILVLSVIAAAAAILPGRSAAGTSERQDPLSTLDVPDRILFQAERSGLWTASEYPIDKRINPFYLRGDFNGDGENDLAFLVKEARSGRQGIAIIHSTLDSLWIFGAGRLFGGSDQIASDNWYVLPRGTTLRQPWHSIPEIGMRAGEAFTFAQEAVSPVWVGKSSFAIYWYQGRYYYVQVAD